MHFPSFLKDFKLQKFLLDLGHSQYNMPLIFQNCYSDVPTVSNVFFAAEFEHGNFPVGLQN